MARYCRSEASRRRHPFRNQKRVVIDAEAAARLSLMVDDMKGCGLLPASTGNPVSGVTERKRADGEAAGPSAASPTDSEGAR